MNLFKYFCHKNNGTRYVNFQLSIDNFAQRGFTIVELMMTMFMSSIILISIYVIVSKSHEYIIAAKPKIQLQQDFSLIQTLLSSKIRLSLHGQHEIYNNYSDYVASQPEQSSGTCMKLYFSSGDSTILYKDNSDFKIMNTDSTFTNLVPGVLDSLIFTKKTNSVQAKVSLSQGTWSLEQTFVAAFRNFSSVGDLGNRRCELVIQSSKVPASLTDFAVLLTDTTLPSEMFDADGANPALNGGGDIKFSSDEAGATRLSCEIVTFTTDNNPALGKAEIWVKVPSVSAGSNTSIWVWYDKSGESQPAANAEFGSESVWAAGIGVYHLDEDPGPGGADEMLDSDGTANHGTAEASMDSGDLVAGRIGNAIHFNGPGSDNSVTFAPTDFGDTCTISLWFKPTTTGDAQSLLTNKDVDGGVQDGFQLRITDAGRIIFNTGNGAVQGNANTLDGVINFGQWNHVAVEVNRAAGTAVIYHNGVDANPGDPTIRTDFKTNDDWQIGNRVSLTQDFLGEMDELRVETVTRSADWIAADHNNQDDPATFVIEGTPETP